MNRNYCNHQLNQKISSTGTDVGSTKIVESREFMEEAESGWKRQRFLPRLAGNLKCRSRHSGIEKIEAAKWAEGP